MTNSARAASVGRALILMRDDLDDDDMADNAKTRPKALPSANRSRLFPSPIRLRSQRASAGGMGDRMQAEQPPTAIVGPRKATTTTTTSSTPSNSALRPRVLLRSSPTRELPPNTMIASCEFRRSPGALAS
uniref:Uncharacterized protein n=1 Tax=Plectus sambesii TaxID=2011161 RepID=A0A914WXJ3_9BILA